MQTEQMQALSFNSTASRSIKPLGTSTLRHQQAASSLMPHRLTRSQNGQIFLLINSVITFSLLIENHLNENHLNDKQATVSK